MKEKQKILVAIVVFTVAIGGLAALNYFKYKERGKLLAKIDSLEKEEKKANDMIRQIPELRAKKKSLSEIIDQYASILPPEEHTRHEAFAEIIDGYSQETQVVIQKVGYLEPEKAKGKKKKKKKGGAENFVRHRYRVKLVGEYQNFLRFINKIENHTRFLKIDEILIPSGKGQVLEGDIIYREEPGGRSIFRCHVRDGGPVGEAQRREPGAVKLDQFPDDAVFTQHLGDPEYEIGRSRAFGELSGELLGVAGDPAQPAAAAGPEQRRGPARGRNSAGRDRRDARFGRDTAGRRLLIESARRK